MSRTVSVALLSALAVATPALALAAEPFQLATMDEVERMLSAKDVAVYDANPPEVFAKNHLPGARFVGPDFGAKTLPSDRATRLVFYCANPH